MNEINPEVPETSEDKSPQPQASPDSAPVAEPAAASPEDNQPEEKEIDLNALFPGSETDLNELFTDPETRLLLKKIQRNQKDLHTLKDRILDESRN